MRAIREWHWHCNQIFELCSHPVLPIPVPRVYYCSESSQASRNFTFKLPRLTVFTLDRSMLLQQKIMVRAISLLSNLPHKLSQYVLQSSHPDPLLVMKPRHPSVHSDVTTILFISPMHPPCHSNAMHQTTAKYMMPHPNRTPRAMSFHYSTHLQLVHRSTLQ